MKTPHLLAYALSTPWAMMPERMAAYAAVLARHYAGELPPAAFAKTDRHAELMAEVQAAVARGASGGQRSGGIAVVPVFGSMVEWASQIDMCDGGTSTRAVSQALTDAENDETVSQILMVFSTPGGSVYGTSETGDVINRVKATKPVIGVAQSLAASAGYWLLSQCTEAYCAPGGEVGSIGVYSGYENIAKALEAAGIDVELFSAGQYKTELSPFSKEGLSAEARAYQIQRANDYFAMFTKAVAKGRGKPIDAVRNGMGQGRVLGADAALAAGMIDGVMTMEQVIRKMQRTASASSRGARAAAVTLDVTGVADSSRVLVSTFTSARTIKGNVASAASQAAADEMADQMDADGCVNCTNCSGCTDCTDCADCTNCTGCTGCKSCDGCTDCTDCEGCTNCTGGNGMSGMTDGGQSSASAVTSEQLARASAARLRGLELLSL